MNKKILLAVGAVLGALAVYMGLKYYVAPTESMQPIYMIPKDAIYVVELDQSVEAWETISGHPMWAHLRTNAYFAELTSSADALEELVRNNTTLKALVGKRTILASAHMFKHNDYDFLFVVDLQRESKLPIQSTLESFGGSGGYQVTTRQYHGQTIVELLDKATRETLYLCIVKNVLVGSYRAKLLEASIDQMEEPYIGRNEAYLDVNRAVSMDGIARVYLQYAFLDEYMKCYLSEPNEYINAMSKELLYTALDCQLDPDGMMRMKGFTNLNDSINSFSMSMLNSGTGGLSITEVAPQRTAFYMGMGFSSFLTFFENMEKLMQETNKEYAEYQSNIAKVEKFLKISIKDHFMSWIDDELAFVQTQPGKLGKKNEFAVILKAKSGEEAKEKLGILADQIRKKTPVKFKEVKYKEYSINFLSVKGFFKLMLGGFFGGLEKPYYTIIDDYVVFSNHPQTLKSIIDDYDAKKTLAQSPDFQAFRKEFKSESNIFIYVQTPVLHNNLREFASADTWKDLEKNKQYMICFSHIGFQLSKDGDKFATNMACWYQDPKKVETNMQALLMQSEGGQWTVVGAEGDSLGTGDIGALVEDEDIVAIDDISPDDLDAPDYQEKFEGTEQVKFTVKLKNGLKHGEYTEYHPNGQIKFKGHFKNDQRDGIWKEYDDGGKKIRKFKYKDGQLME